MSKPIIAGDRSYALPPVGGQPSTDRQGKTPGSFARRGGVGTPWMFSSPDTPGMPGVSELTAMDFAHVDDARKITQLQIAREGIISSEMQRVAMREPHLTAEQIRLEV